MTIDLQEFSSLVRAAHTEVRGQLHTGICTPKLLEPYKVLYETAFTEKDPELKQELIGILEPLSHCLYSWAKRSQHVALEEGDTMRAFHDEILNELGLEYRLDLTQVMSEQDYQTALERAQFGHSVHFAQDLGNTEHCHKWVTRAIYDLRGQIVQICILHPIVVVSARERFNADKKASEECQVMFVPEDTIYETLFNVDPLHPVRAHGAVFNCTHWDEKRYGRILRNLRGTGVDRAKLATPSYLNLQRVTYHEGGSALPPKQTLAWQIATQRDELFSDDYNVKELLLNELHADVNTGQATNWGQTSEISDKEQKELLEALEGLVNKLNVDKLTLNVSTLHFKESLMQEMANKSCLKAVSYICTARETRDYITPKGGAHGKATK